jgi:hypothetical protein
MHLAVVCAMRRSEMFALPWKDWYGACVMVDESVWRVIVKDEPKTDVSKALVYMPESLQRDLAAWHGTPRMCNAPESKHRH